MRQLSTTGNADPVVQLGSNFNASLLNAKESSVDFRWNSIWVF